MLEPSTAIRQSARKMKGNDSMTSTMRMMTVSTHPPKNPASRPSVTPISMDTTTANRPTMKEILAP